MRARLGFALVAPAISIAACASASGGAHERGLATLRVQLGTGVPVGEVVADRLVHTASGLTLARLPAGTWNASGLTGTPVLFEGAPGVAMLFEGTQLSFARVRGGELEQVLVHAPEYPKPSVVTAGDLAIIDDVPESDGVALELAVPARGVSARFSALAWTVRSADGEELFKSTALPVEGPVCRGKFTASLARAALPDGSVLFRYERSAVVRVADSACTAEIQAQSLDSTFEEGSRRHEQTELTWLRFPASGGAPSVVESELVVADDYSSITTDTLVLDIPGGQLLFERTSEEAIMGGPNEAWSWIVVRDDGATYDLAVGYGAP